MPDLTGMTPNQLQAALRNAAATGDIETLRAIEEEARGRQGVGQPPVQQAVGGLRSSLYPTAPPVPEPMAQLEAAMRAARVPGSVAMLPGGQYEVTQWAGGGAEKALRQVKFAQDPGLGLTTQGRLIVPQAGETQAQTAAQSLGQYFAQPLTDQAPWSEFVSQHPYVRTAIPSAAPYGAPKWTEAPPSPAAMATLQALRRFPERYTPEEVAARPELVSGAIIPVSGWTGGVSERLPTQEPQGMMGIGTEHLQAQVGWGAAPGGAVQAPVGAAKFLGRARISGREFPTRMVEIMTEGTQAKMMTAKFAGLTGEPVTGLSMRTAIVPGAPVGPGITPVLSSAVKNVLLMSRKFEREPLSWEQFQGFKGLVKPGTGVRPGQPIVSIGGLETGLTAAGRTQELYLEALRVNLPATAQVGRYLQREFPEQFGALSGLEQKLMLRDPTGGKGKSRWLQTAQQIQLPTHLRLGGGTLRGGAWSPELEVAYQEIYPFESGRAVGGVPSYKGVMSRQTALDLDLPGVQMILAGEGMKALPTMTAMLAQNVPREQWLKYGLPKSMWPEDEPFRIGAQPEIEETMRKMLFTKPGQHMLRGLGVLRTRPYEHVSRDPLEIAAYQKGGALEGQAQVTPLEGEAARIKTTQDILVGDMPVYPTSYPGRAAPGRLSATDLAELAKYDPSAAKELWEQGATSRTPAMGILQAIYGQARDPRKLKGFMMPTAAAQELAGEREPTDVETWQALAQEYGTKPLEVPLGGAGPPGMRTLQLPGPEYARTLSHQLRTGEEVTAFGRGYMGVLRALGGEEEAPELGEAVERYLPAAAEIGRSQELIRRAFGGEQELSASATVLTDPSLKLGEIGVGSEVAKRLGIRPGERTGGLLRRWPTLFSSVTQKMGLGTRVLSLEEIAKREGSKIDPAGSPHSIYVSPIFETPGQLDYDKDTATVFRLLKSGRDVLAKQMPAYKSMISRVADMVTQLDPEAQTRAGAGATPEQIIGQATGIGAEKYAKGLEPRRLSQIGTWQKAFFDKGETIEPAQQAQAMAAQKVGKGIVGQVNIMLQNYRYMMDVYGMRGGEQEQGELELSRIQQTALDKPGASMQELRGKFGDILKPFLYSPLKGGRTKTLGATWETETGRLARATESYKSYGDLPSWIQGASQAGMSAGTIEMFLRTPGAERSEQMQQAISGVVSGQRGAISELTGLLPREAYERTIQGRLSRAWSVTQLERRLAYEEDPERRAEIEQAMRLPAMQAAAPLAQELTVARAMGTTRAGVATFPEIAGVAPRLGGLIGSAARGALGPGPPPQQAEEPIQWPGLKGPMPTGFSLVRRGRNVPTEPAGTVRSASITETGDWEKAFPGGTPLWELRLKEEASLKAGWLGDQWVDPGTEREALESRFKGTLSQFTQAWKERLERITPESFGSSEEYQDWRGTAYNEVVYDPGDIAAMRLVGGKAKGWERGKWRAPEQRAARGALKEDWQRADIGEYVFGAHMRPGEEETRRAQEGEEVEIKKAPSGDVSVKFTPEPETPGQQEAVVAWNVGMAQEAEEKAAKLRETLRGTPEEQDAKAVRLASEASEIGGRRAQRPGAAGGFGPPMGPPGGGAPPSAPPMGGGGEGPSKWFSWQTEEGAMHTVPIKEQRLNQEYVNRMEKLVDYLGKFGEGLGKAAETTERYDDKAKGLERAVGTAQKYWEEAEKIRQMGGGTVEQQAQMQALTQRMGAAGAPLAAGAEQLEFQRAGAQAQAALGGGIGGFFQQAGGIGAGLGQIAGGAAKQLTSGWGLIYMNRMRSLFMQPVQQAMGEYAGQQLAGQQAMYMAGMPGGMEGAPAGILAGRARMGQFRAGVGEAGWQAWGGLQGQLGGQPGAWGPGLAIGAPALGAGLMAAYLAPAAIAGPVGLAAGLGVAAAGAIGYGAGAMRDRPAMALAAAGEGGFRGELGLELTGQGLSRQAYPGLYGPETRALPRGAQAPLTSEQQALAVQGRQIMGGNLQQLGQLGPEYQTAALQYFTQERLAPQLPTMEQGQLAQLTGAYMGMTGQQDIGQFNQQLMVAAGQRAQMLGVQQGQAFQPWQQLAQQMGFGPMGQQAERMAEQALLPQRRRIGGAFEEEPGIAPIGPSEREIQQQLYEQQQVAPFVREARGRWGRDVTEEAFAPLMGEGMGPQRSRMEQFMAGNRQMWSDVGRQMGRPEWITMEEGGLPIYTTEMRGAAGDIRGEQRGYRDWQWQQQGAQLTQQGQYMMGPQWQQGIVGGMWGLQNQQRALQTQQQEWQFDIGGRQFAQAGAQWQEQFDVSGRQWQESQQLGRNIFEARVGWQQQDIGTQQQRAETQFGWKMQDWGYQENVSQLQAGWQQEDLTQAIRFSSGRERRQLQQQQERLTISESMRRGHHEEQKDRMEEARDWEEEDFEKQKERNEELIGLQRGQFELKQQHFEENREMQQRFHDDDRQLEAERMERQREFYYAGKELEGERIDMERENWKKQYQWALEAHGKAGEYNKEMDRLQDKYREWQEKQADTIANFQKLMLYLDESEESIRDIVDALLKLSGGFASSDGSSYDYRSGEHTGLQHGGPVMGPTAALLGEAGEEYVVPKGGALVKGGEASEKLLSQIHDVLVSIRVLQEQGMDVNVSVVQGAGAAQEHVLTLEDGSYTNWPR